MASACIPPHITLEFPIIILLFAFLFFTAMTSCHHVVAALSKHWNKTLESRRVADAQDGAVSQGTEYPVFEQMTGK